MDDLKTKLLSLTDQELRDYLEGSGGYDGTPVTPSTRMLLVRKLTRNLLKNVSTDDAQGINTSKNDSSSNEHTTNHIPRTENDVKLGSCSESTEQDLKVLYFGVFFPVSHDTAGTNKLQRVFTDKKEFMKFMKEYPQARFKVFQTKGEAETFISQGPNILPLTIERDTSVKDFSTPTVTSGEKSAFKAPHHQELIQLRKIIEKGDETKFHEHVWKNPRYMISSGDTPTILQEGSRYNALHIASKAGNGVMCKAVLETISNPSFIHLLYNGFDESSNREVKDSLTVVPKNEDKAVMDCIAYLLDLYLNTPEKGLNETPLHFACKFGKVEAVRVLLSYPLCDRTRLNKLGETAEDIICSRAGKGSDAEKEIRQLIKDCFYVPVMRPGDLSIQAFVGDPFSPEKLPTTPPVCKDPKSPTLEMNAFAGPMNLEKAQEFCGKLKSSRKVKASDYPNIMSPTARLKSPCSSSSSGSLRLCDPERGLEREGRALADEFHVGWKEYWPFLGQYVNLAAREGMQALENYFHEKLMDAYNLKKQSQDEEEKKGKTSSALPNDENGCRTPKENNCVPEQVTPVSELCLALKSCTLSSGERETEKMSQPSKIPICANLSDTQPGVVSPSPLQYVEKSCCVFSRRISDVIAREGPGGNCRVLFRALGLEVNHLCRLVTSFKEDARFLSVNFSHMHSRVADMAADEILTSLTSSSISEVLSVIESILSSSSHHCSSSDEDDDRYLERECDSQIGGREWRISMRHGLTKNDGVRMEDRVAHGHCLLSLIKEALEEKRKYEEPTHSKIEEANQIESTWAEVKPCSCTWPKFSQHHAKGSFRAAAAASVVRKLSFEKLPVEDGNAEYVSSENSKHSNKQIASSESHQAVENTQKISEHNWKGDESDGSEFYTPPSSPDFLNNLQDSSDDEEMVDSEELPRIFVGGEHPTKQDLDVLYALGDATKINMHEFPLLYQWRNLVLMHTTEERESWPSPLSPRWKRQYGAADMYSEKNILRRVYKSPTGAYLLGHHH